MLHGAASSLSAHRHRQPCLHVPVMPCRTPCLGSGFRARLPCRRKSIANECAHAHSSHCVQIGRISAGIMQDIGQSWVIGIPSHDQSDGRTCVGSSIFFYGHARNSHLAHARHHQSLCRNLDGLSLSRRFPCDSCNRRFFFHPFRTTRIARFSSAAQFHPITEIRL